MTEYILCLILFCVGLYAVLVKRNMIKIIIGLGIMEYAINLFFVLIGYRKDGIFPIFSEKLSDRYMMVDPTPQVLVLTSITIGLSMTCLLVAIAMRIYQRFHSYDIRDFTKLKG